MKALFKLRDERNDVFKAADADYDATLVAIDDAVIETIELPREQLTTMSSDLHNTAPGASMMGAAEYLLLLNSLNFRFWDLADGKFTRYEYKGLVGALGMRAAFAEAWEDHPYASRFWKNLYVHGVKGIFGNIPAVIDRATVLSELNQFYASGKFYKVVRDIVEAALNKRRFTLVDAKEIALALPLSYGDRYLKKAQLMLSELASFASEAYHSVDCSELTLFADYQLPRVMRAMGILKYSYSIAEAVDSQTLIAADSREECAIRAATVLAGDRLTKKLKCTCAELDNYLCLNRKKATGNFHLTMTTDY